MAPKTRKSRSKKAVAVPVVEAPKTPTPVKTPAKAAVKVEPKSPELVSAARKKGIWLFNLAGRPTKEQFVIVYGEKGPKMTWDQRAAAGVPAEKFKEAFAAKVGK